MYPIFYLLNWDYIPEDDLRTLVMKQILVFGESLEKPCQGSMKESYW